MSTQARKILLVEDHSFFANEIRDYLETDCGYQVIYAKNYNEAVRAIRRYGPFTFSLLDILLQNGKTGVDIVEKYQRELGRVMFITGCIDETILSKIEHFASASKLTEIWNKLDSFIKGGTPKIDDYGSSSYHSIGPKFVAEV